MHWKTGQKNEFGALLTAYRLFYDSGTTEAAKTLYGFGATINRNGPGTNLRFCSDQRQ
jgi:hypothetical protein